MYELIINPSVAENINDNKVLQIKFIEECFRLYPSIHKIKRILPLTIHSLPKDLKCI
jgi:hypothetical protein